MADTTTTAPDTTNASPVRAITRCIRKGCRKAYRVDFHTTYELVPSFGRPVARRTVIVDGRESSYRDRHDLRSTVMYGKRCECGASLDFKIVEGTFTESVKCGARCRNAVGPACDCACAGENHSAGLSVAALG